MKTKTIKVLYRNWIFYKLRFILPKTMKLYLVNCGAIVKICDCVPGISYSLLMSYDIRPVNLIETIVFAVYIDRRKK
jgi:hypothetical protein